VAFSDCVLGAVRLAIVDVEGGDQPMRGPRDTAVVFNGEVYGHQRLRADLSYPFRTECDTETTLALYDDAGVDMAARLPGMFALALWDEGRGHLLCARDRFGEKPFFWALGPDGEFVFASEIKALLASGLVTATVDRTMVAHYLRHAYVHPSRTIYENVHVLAPARQMVVTPEGSRRTRRYWDPPPVRRHLRAEEAAEELQARLARAVQDQLVADVEVAALLSGGVDSSTVVALAADHHDGLRTFSLGFGGDGDETPFAEAQARYTGTKHETVLVRDDEILTTLQALPAVYDEPFGDSSAVPTYLLCKVVRGSATVALGGDGADELLGGYAFWSRNYLADRGHDLGRLRPSWWRSSTRLARAYAGFRSYFDSEALEALGLPSVTDAAVDWSRYRTGTLADLLRYDAEGYLPGDILVKTDRAAMAHSLELRSPYLDVGVAEWCLAVPDDLKVDATSEKLVLRRAFSDRWAPAVRERDKQGFGAPMAEWLARPGLRELQADLFAPTASVHDLVAPEGVAPLLESGSDQQRWSLLVLALWAEFQRTTPR
jgi:asparagine synthase (glutamine-hydrolysing)